MATRNSEQPVRERKTATRDGEQPKRQRMALEDRAKIFSPFDPLTGFRAALREKEREVEEEVSRGVSPAGALRRPRG